MQITRAGSAVVVQTPAKLNLFFEVLGRRDDGYHEIETLMCPIDLYDTLAFTPTADQRVALHCHRAGVSLGLAGDPGDLPLGPQNLVVRALELLRQRADVRGGARVKLVKRIPLAAGLGGGSSDAAAALAAANLGWSLNWPLAKLMPLAAELGSDVPFFLAGGPALCRGRGERIEPVGGMGMLHFVVARPPEGLSTAAVYRACRPATAPHRVEKLLEALRAADPRRAGGLLANRLEEAAEQLSPWIARLRQDFSRLDCLGQGMSGSGTSYFGWCRHARHARRTAARLKASGWKSVFAVRSCL